MTNQPVRAGNVSALAGKFLALYRAVCAVNLSLTQPRPVPQTLTWSLIVVVLGVAPNSAQFRDFVRPPAADGHANLALEMAVHRCLFGTVSSVVNLPSDRCPHERYSTDREVTSKQLLSLWRDVAASPKEYAGYLLPFANGENSLMLLDALLLWLNPNSTLSDLIRAHVEVKMACLAFFVLFLLRIGVSPLITFAAFHLGLVTTGTVNQVLPLSQYPYLLPLTVLLVALLGLTLSFGMHRRKWLEVPILILIGVFGGFLFNLRTSYTVVGWGLVLVYGVVGLRDLSAGKHFSRLRASVLFLLPLLCFLAGTKAFSRLFIQPIRVATASVPSGGEHHPIAHPVVLALALPPTDLSQREGIEWDDPCGFTLAQRMDPAVTYLGPRYEAALWLYYVKLWLYYPAEMRVIYRKKFEAAGVSCLRQVMATAGLTNPVPACEVFGPSGPWDRTVAPVQEWLTRVLYAGIVIPLKLLPLNGLALQVFSAAVVIVPLFLRRYLSVGAAYGLAGLAAAASLLLLESTIIMPFYYTSYHAYLYFWFLCLGLLGCQVMLNLLPPALQVTTWRVKRCWRRLRSAGKPGQVESKPIASGAPDSAGPGPS